MSLLIAPLSCQQDDTQPVSPNSDDATADQTVELDDYFVSLEEATLVAANAQISELVSDGDINARVAEKKKKPKKIRKSKTIPDRENRPAFYIFDYEGSDDGFTIVSADKREMPILAYSDDGDFNLDDTDDIPDALIFWMLTMEEEIYSVREKKRKATNNSAREWEEIQTVSEFLKNNPNARDICAEMRNARCDDDDNPPQYPITTTYGPLLRTEWDQGCGYNNDTRIPSGGPCGRAWTGCVATAMAQVMRFHQSPAGYNWADMPNTSGSREISRLMADIGEDVNMNYSSGGSGADEDEIAPAFVNNFGYSSASLRGYDRYRIRDNIRWNDPVILVGWRDRDCGFLGLSCNYVDGHAWVCDGTRQVRYETAGYFYLHMNWGWGGSRDGWFAYNNWDPGSLSFNRNRKMISEIRP